MKTLAIALTVLALALAAQAEMVSFQQGIDGYAGCRDTELRSPDPSLNTGNNDEVSIDAKDGDEAYSPTHGLLAFDGIIAADRIPAGSTIHSATVRLMITSKGSGWKYHRMLTDWNENTVTWNSFVGGVQADGIEALALATATDGANNGDGNVLDGWYSLDLTADVQAWADGAANYGWAILPIGTLGTNGIDFIASEGSPTSMRPMLTVEFTSVPEPAGMGLLALGGLALIRRRK